MKKEEFEKLYPKVVPHWFNVNEQLPDDHSRVLVLVKNIHTVSICEAVYCDRSAQLGIDYNKWALKDPITGQFCFNYDGKMSMCGVTFDSEITHWTPLFELPSDV